MKNLIALGSINAIRNLSRSVMAALAMTLAALLMTSSLTFAEGHTSQVVPAYRTFFGGDVLVYPAWVQAGPSELRGSGEPGRPVGFRSLEVVALPTSFASPLRYFHPNYYWEGCLVPVGTSKPYWSMFGSATEQRSLTDSLGDYPGIAAAATYSAVSAIDVLARGKRAGLPAGQEATLNFPPGQVLRLAPPSLLAEPGREYASRAGGEPGVFEYPPENGPGVYLITGRWLLASDGPLAVMVNRETSPGVELGDRLTVSVPALGRGEGWEEGRGAPGLVPGGPDAAVKLEFEVVGVYTTYTRDLHYTTGEPSGKSAGSEIEDLYLHAPEILLSPAAYAEVLEAIGLRQGEPEPVGALVLTLADQSTANATCRALRREFPEYAFITVATEAGYANLRNAPEPIVECPTGSRPIPGPWTQATLAATSRSTLGLITYALAGLIAAGNSTILVIGRRKEFAILKAIGLRGFEVGLVILSEILTLAGIGLVVGFGLAQIAYIPALVTNQVSGVEALRRAVQGFLWVGGGLLGTAALFALAPIRKTLAISVAEVMRDDA